MKYLIFTVTIIIVFILSYSNVNLRLENMDHVRINSLITSQNLDAIAENKKLENELYRVTEKHETEISSKDIKIRRLVKAVVELYQMIQTAKNKDRIT